VNPRIEDLTAKFIEDTLSRDESAELHAAAERDPKIVAYIADEWEMHRVLHAAHTQDVPSMNIVEQVLYRLRIDSKSEAEKFKIKIKSRLKSTPADEPLRRRNIVSLFMGPETRVIVVAAAACLLIALGVWKLREEPTPLAPVANLASDMTIRSCSGEVTIERQDGLQRAEIGSAVPAGSRLQCSAGGIAQAARADGTAITLGRSSEVVYTADLASAQISMIKGAVYYSVAKQAAGTAFKIHTPSTDVVVVGTEFEVVVEDKKTVVRVEQGVVRVIAGSNEVSLSRGYESIVEMNAAPSSPRKIALSEIAAWRNPTHSQPKQVAENLFKDGGFEKKAGGAKSDTFEAKGTPWRFVENPRQQISKRYSATEKHSGEHALHVSLMAGSQHLTMTQTCAITGGESYDLKFWMKRNNVNLKCRLKWLSNDGRQAGEVNVAQVSDNSPWEEVSKAIIAPADAALVEFRVDVTTAKDPGEIWFDDCSLTRHSSD
jgi:hypothetical protein